MLWFFDCGIVRKAVDDALRAAMNTPQSKLKEIEPLHIYQLFTPMAIWCVGMTICSLTFCIETCNSKCCKRRPRGPRRIRAQRVRRILVENLLEVE